MRRIIRPGSRVVAAVGGVLTAEFLWAAFQPAPRYVDLDPSGLEGVPTDAGAPLRMVVLGDSSCTGPGLEDPGDIWVRQMARRVAERTPVDVRSVAVGGSTATDVLRQVDLAIAQAADIALVSVGGNDVLRGRSARRFRSELDEIAGRLAATHELVILSGVGDLGSIPRLLPPLDRVLRRRAMTFDRIHADVAAAHDVVKADQWASAAAEFNRRSDIWSGDRFHPNVEGHRIWAEVGYTTLTPHLERLLSGRGPSDR